MLVINCHNYQGFHIYNENNDVIHPGLVREMSNILILLFLIVSGVQSDWVEITQKTKNENISKKSDYTMFLLTTSSTTTTTPIFNKPVHSIHSHSDYNNEDINRSAEDYILTTQNVKNNVLPPTTIKPTTKQNFTKGQVYKIDKTTQKLVDSSTFGKFDFKRRSSVDEPIEEENFINDSETSYSYTNFIPFLSKVQSTLMKNAHKNKKSKLSVLSGLRDHLLYEIQNRMAHLWKPKSDNRASREYKEDSHMDFPSNESALITIGFLTFAVFLIKLVMQLINALSGTTTTTMIVGRKRRDTLNEDALRILSQIQQYTLK
ncbi:hypothetical protein FQR65_LT06397 [Abscondita terminalis]|nr:hypothetical protein FQR65_LT06397 [Abscondita terminalis]